MADSIKPNTAAWHKRMWVHRHNSFQGFVSMGLQHMRNIRSAGSVTPEAAQCAAEIEQKLHELGALLKTRVDL